MRKKALHTEIIGNITVSSAIREVAKPNEIELDE